MFKIKYYSFESERLKNDILFKSERYCWHKYANNGAINCNSKINICSLVRKNGNKEKESIFEYTQF